MQSMRFDQVIDHPLQREIMSRLVQADVVRFGSLKPKGIESNLFLYHLRQLIRAGYVEQADKGSYRLTLKGKQYSDRSNIASMRLRVQPKLLTILVVRHEDGDYVILERLHQPHLNVKGFPSGKIHYGESLDAAAVRELEEKTGLTDVSLTLRGSVAIRFFWEEDKETVVNHIIGYVFSGTVSGDKAPLKEETHFKSYWGTKEQLVSEKSFKGNQEIIDLLETGESFTASFEFVSSL